MRVDLLVSRVCPASKHATLQLVHRADRLPASLTVPAQERLPSPFGLVRTGVAPDHADTKVRSCKWTTECLMLPSNATC